MRKNKLIMGIGILMSISVLSGCYNVKAPEIQDDGNVAGIEDNLSDNNDIQESEENNEQESPNDEDNKQNDVKDIILNKKWQYYYATDLDANEISFGSGVINNPGWLIFNTDGTFEHILPGVTTGEEETEGTYVIGDDGRIYLTYNDGTVNYGDLFITQDGPEVSLIDLDRNTRMYFKIADFLSDFDSLSSLSDVEKKAIENKAANLVKEYMNIDAAMYYDTGYALSLLGFEYKGPNFTYNIQSNGLILLNMNRSINNIFLATANSKELENYVDTEIRYEDFKQALLKYISEDYFNVKYKNNDMFKNVNGVLYIQGSGATGVGYNSVEAKLVSIDGEKYLFNANVTIEYINEIRVVEHEFEMIMTAGELRLNGDIKSGKTISTEKIEV